MMDLCSGFGGASQAMKDRGWQVLRVDIEPAVKPDVVGDIRALPLCPYQLDLLWASPPCTEYSRSDLPWFHDETEPDPEAWFAAEASIAAWHPTYWVIENVRGAQRFRGPSTVNIGSQHLWTNIPALIQPVFTRRLKRNLCSGNDPLRGAKRGYIPYPISLAVALSVEAAVGRVS